jgi:hypothetical protein
LETERGSSRGRRKDLKHGQKPCAHAGLDGVVSYVPILGRWTANMSAAGWIVGNGEKREAGGGVYSSYGTQAGRAERVTTKTILVEEFPRGAEVKPATVRQAERLMRGANHKADGMERGEVRSKARVR